MLWHFNLPLTSKRGLQPNGLLLILSDVSYSKVWYTSIVAPTLLPHLFTRELLVTKWAELYSVRVGNSPLTVLRKCKNSKEDCWGHNVHIRRHRNIFAEHDFMTKWKLVYRKIHPLKLFSMEVQYVHSNERKKTVPRYFFFSLIGLKLSGRNCETINCAFLSGLHSLKEVQWWAACAASHNLSLCFSQPLFISFFN